MKILLENKLELGRFIKIFKKIPGEILGTEKCDLSKSGFLAALVAPPWEYPPPPIVGLPQLSILIGLASLAFALRFAIKQVALPENIPTAFPDTSSRGSWQTRKHL